ncbi:hypothetical protein STSP2_00661 [Anaerohalosphaera lusitana]|uniref:Cytochrome P460 domain-containing protein n=1 Tax=Anaerohalosphaera lusitana TaxID=1936003 RepID=A0A1U9NHW0_9BACT|nr:cytochrome P460 family protein [Anaerohalosphaera lusitana]AQT67513.1 hypothetical protein STSP2_00661 [Anaerohalosphaera lusitana]
MNMHTKLTTMLITILITLLITAGCEQRPEDAGAEETQTPTQRQVEPEDQQQKDWQQQQDDMQKQQRDQQQQSDNPNSADAEYAEQLWTKIKDYENWTVPENFKGWQDGVSPHGKILKYYINDAAAEDLTQDGAIIVKENYSEKSEDALMAITIMEKRQGYDPETGDWFYVKYDPAGKVMTNPAGKKLAGLIGKGKSQGCIPCHAAAKGNDYLFMNDEKARTDRNDPNTTN